MTLHQRMAVLSVLTLGVALLAACGSEGIMISEKESVSESGRETVALSGGPLTLDLTSGVGEITIQAGDDPAQVVVEYVKTAYGQTKDEARAELAAMTLAISQEADAITINSVQQAHKNQTRANTVDLTITVPPAVGLRLVNNVGEVQVRGANVFKGYWRQPEKTAAAFTADGWLRTGDLGMREPDGYFTLKGRSKDLIISGGYNVHPPEVELALADHPAVETSAVIGCPDAEWGERVVALVVLRAGAVASETEMIAFCRQRLAAYKTPKRIVFVDALPRNAMGKVQKTELRRLFCA